MKNFAGLSDKQLEVFEAIARGQQEGHNHRTLFWLETKGFIVRRYEIPEQWRREYDQWKQGK